MTIFESRRINMLRIRIKIMTLYNNAADPVINEGDILFTCRKHFRDRIITLRGGVWTINPNTFYQNVCAKPG